LEDVLLGVFVEHGREAFHEFGGVICQVVVQIEGIDGDRRHRLRRRWRSSHDVEEGCC